MPEVWCLRHAESENVVAGASGALPLSPLTPLGREQARRAAPALTGIRTVYASTALRALPAAGADAGLVGHVGSLTLAVGVLAGLGGAVWGAPLPHAVPFAVGWDGKRWHCPRWPG